MKILNAKSIIASCLTAAVMSAAISVPVLADSVDITEIDMDVTLSMMTTVITEHHILRMEKL